MKKPLSKSTSFTLNYDPSNKKPFELIRENSQHPVGRKYSLKGVQSLIKSNPYFNRKGQVYANLNISPEADKAIFEEAFKKFSENPSERLEDLFLEA